MRSSWVYTSGIYTLYPFQAHTHGLPAEVIKECLLGLIHAKYERDTTQKPKNFAEWILATFGEGIAKHFMLPYNYRAWAIPLELMDYNTTVYLYPTLAR